MRFSVFEVDLEMHELRKHGVRIKLPGQPFQALAILLDRPGEVVTREEFRMALWPDQSWGEHDHRLNKIVNKIREALSDSAETPRFIETIPRVGYRFLLQVERLDERASRVTEAPTEPVPIPVLAPQTVALSENRLRGWMFAPAILLTAVLGAIAANRLIPGSAAVPRLVEPSPLTTYVGSETYPAISPDGRDVAFAWDGEAGRGFHIYVASTTGGGARQLTSGHANDGAPAWSADGRELAFLRDGSPGAAELWLMHADGSGAHRLREIRNSVSGGPPSWTRDQKWLVVSQAAPSHSGIPALYRVSVESGVEQQITFLTPGQPGGDVSPAVSPDGTRLAFARSTSPSWRDIFVVPLANGQMSGAPLRVTDESRMIDRIAWAADGRSLVFSAATTTAGARHLYSVDARSKSIAKAKELGIEGEYPAVSASSGKLAYVRKNIEQSSFWQLALTGSAEQPAQVRLFSSTRRDYTADPAPDGKHLVFSSVRSGPTELWMSKTDGTELRRLTSIGGSAPRWSPDGKEVAFECNRDGQPDIYVLTVDSGAIRRLTAEGAPNRRPTWSRDGKFIYYASNRSGRPQIWKLPAWGGNPIQITRRGATYALETFDAKSIYYITADTPAEIWTTGSNGGDENQVLTQAVGYSALAMGRDGLFYMARRTASDAEVAFYTFNGRASRILATIDHPVHPVLSGSPDGRSVLYSQVDRVDTDLMLLDPFVAQ